MYCKTHPLTGAPIVPLGYTKSGRVIWPVMGGSQPSGEPNTPPAATPAPTGPAPQPNPANPANQPPPPMFPPPGMGLNEHGYPDHTPVQNMTVEHQAAYWRAYARRNEDRIKAMGDYADLKKQSEAYQKHLEETATEQQKAVTAAEQRGRQSALAEAGSQMVEAYVRAAATGRMSEEQVSTLLQGLDRTRFVNPATGQVDAQMISGYISMLAPPVPGAGGMPAPMYAPPIPGQVPGQPVLPGVPFGAYQQQPGYPPNPAGAVAPVPNQPHLYPGQPPGGQWPVYPPQPQTPGGAPDMGGDRQVPRYGQAQYPPAPASGLEAGKAVARARFGTNKPASQ